MSSVEPEGPKQEPKQESEQLTVVIKEASGAEVQFKVKSTTKFQKIFRTYCEKKALNRDSVRFNFDGERINENQTPADLEMEDGDVIDCMIEQLGGTC
mmetsp:Transcript_28137/g.75966  ORF Transcript_28137/g.75966 Transcript_28137/m.75966 type:complete len:98 (+) Transcript_28137:86-379(+)